MSPDAGRWSLADRARDLERAEREEVDVLVVGGGITGAGVLRDAATRGLRALLLEAADFASGTSGRSSKMVHGGLRYIGQGHLGVTRQACRERDLLLRLNPNLVRPLPFLFPAYADSRIPLWQVRTALWIYAGLANFRRTSRFRMLRPAAALGRAPSLRSDGLRGAGLFFDAAVDDARLVLETLKSARALGAVAVNRAEVVEFLRGPDGRVAGVRARDTLDGSTRTIRCRAVVNAAGPAVERVRGLDRPGAPAELRPAKGVHLVIPRSRIPIDLAVTFDAPDGRQLFAAPWDDVALVGTTDTFSEEIDAPAVTIEEVHYLLAAANRAFPCAGLTTNDLRSVYAGVRPLAASPDADEPPSSVSREQRIESEASGVVTTYGGKLTTYRAMGESVVDCVVAALPAERRRGAGPSRTAFLPLREDDFPRQPFEAELCRRFGIGAAQAAHLVRSHGRRAEELLARSPSEWLQPIGASPYLLAEIPWCFEAECAVDLCDVLERRMRLALFADGQGLPEIARIAQVAGEAAGWDGDRTRAEIEAYAASVRRHYQIQIAAPRRERPAA